MAYQNIDGVRVWGSPDDGALAQAKTCAQTGNVVQTLLMADHHKGYSQPIGGVVVYDGQISPSGVGYDIACGNKAVRTHLYVDDVKPGLAKIMDEIARKISFGMGRVNNEKVDHDLFDDPDWAIYKAIGKQEHDKLKHWPAISSAQSAAAIILWTCLKKWEQAECGSPTISEAGASGIRRRAVLSIWLPEEIF